MLRVRRRFWILFGGAIFFALGLALLPLPAAPQSPRQLQVVVYREPPGDSISLHHPPTLLVQLVDTDGRLVDHASLQTAANMTAMDMGPLAFQPRQVGQGLYALDLSFNMPGSWWLRLDAQAPDYQKASQTLTFQVQDVTADGSSSFGFEAGRVFFQPAQAGFAAQPPGAGLPASELRRTLP